LNQILHSLHRGFIQSVLDTVRQKGIQAPCYILKADGGTTELSQSMDKPVTTILSGPAASIMGILSMGMPRHDAIAIDMGGTTTDIAVFVNGDPLLEPLGVTLGGYRTLIRGLRSRSIGIGGDSVVKIIKDRIVIGPERTGPAAAFGGQEPTPTDAMVVLGLLPEGNRDASLNVLRPLSEQGGCDLLEMAARIFSATCDEIVKAIKEELENLNGKPVYTIREFLAERRIAPQHLYVVGGPAQIMAAPLGERLGCTPHVFENAEVANAIGVALSRVTDEVTVVADTERRTMIVAEEGLQMPLSRSFSHEEAITFAKEKLCQRAAQAGVSEKGLEMEIVEDQVFPMVRDFYATGENIRVKVQIKPGIVSFPEGDV
jgi:N-methylhydantoinase A/oxoprolinase/acetone carboxylase beta subunit